MRRRAQASLNHSDLMRIFARPLKMLYPARVAFAYKLLTDESSPLSTPPKAALDALPEEAAKP